MKLQAGEYVSLGKVEAALAQSPYVESICVYAESSQSYATCLVVPRAKNLKSLATSLKIDTDDWGELCQKPQLKSEVLKNLHAVGRSCKQNFSCLLRFGCFGFFPRLFYVLVSVLCLFILFYIIMETNMLGVIRKILIK